MNFMSLLLKDSSGLMIKKREQITSLGVAFFLILYAIMSFAGKSKSFFGDAQNYVHIINIFPHYLHAFDKYLAARVFPSSLVAIGLKLLGLNHSAKNILCGFEIMNYLAVFISLMLLWRFSIRFNINLQWRIIVFAGLFLNFPILTVPTLSPVHTDVIAFCFGIGLFYCYCFNHRGMTFIGGLLGSFTYPTFGLFSFFLLLFPYQGHLANENQAQIIPIKKQKNWMVFFVAMSISLFVFATILAAALFVVPSEKYDWLMNTFSNSNFIMGLYLQLPNTQYENIYKSDLFFYPAAVIIVFSIFAYLFLALRPFNDAFIRTCTQFYRRTSWSSLLLAFSFMVINKGLLFLISNDLPGSLTFSLYLKYLLRESSTYPLISLVSMFAYYGPFVFFIVLHWKSICEEGKKNLGIVCSLGLFIGLSLASESRQYINFIGMIAFLFLMTLANRSWHYQRLPKLFPLCFVALSLVYSKCWQHYNLSTLKPITESTLSFLMNFGTWVPFSHYLFNFFIMLLTCLCLNYFSKKRSY